MIRVREESVQQETSVHGKAGGEYNVVRGLRRCFGMKTAVITAFADNEVGKLMEDFILQGGVDTSLINWKRNRRNRTYLQKWYQLYRAWIWYPGGVQ